MLPGGSPPGIAPAASDRRGIDNRKPGRQPLPGFRCFRRTRAARHAPSAEHSRWPAAGATPSRPSFRELRGFPLRRLGGRVALAPGGLDHRLLADRRYADREQLLLAGGHLLRECFVATSVPIPVSSPIFADGLSAAEAWPSPTRLSGNTLA